MNKILAACYLFLIVGNSPLGFAEDGTYQATAKTDGGTVVVSVEVKNSQVVRIVWPDQSITAVSHAYIIDSETQAKTPDGKIVDLKLQDYLEPEEDENDPAQEW